MAVYKRGNTYWYEFQYAGKRYRESAETTSKVKAQQAERDHRKAIQDALRGTGPDPRENLRRKVRDACEAYEKGYGADHAAKSLVWVKETLVPIVDHLGDLRVAELSEDCMKGYMSNRKKKGLGPRRINMEVGNLSRAVGSKWSQLWPKLRKLKEPEDIGKALLEDEESNLRRALLESESTAARTAVFLALSTGMRSIEIKTLQWWQIDFGNRMVTVGESKSDAGTGRQIPMTPELFTVLEAHRDWYIRRFGEAREGWYLLPAGPRGRKNGKGRKEDPTKPIGTIRTAFDSMKKRAGVECRFHDLRHTVCTKMAEKGVPESTMLAIMGHMSRKMLERYSHIRIKAKREAVEALRWNEQPNDVPTKVPTAANSGTGGKLVTH